MLTAPLMGEGDAAAGGETDRRGAESGDDDEGGDIDTPQMTELLALLAGAPREALDAADTVTPPADSSEPYGEEDDRDGTLTDGEEDDGTLRLTDGVADTLDLIDSEAGAVTVTGALNSIEHRDGVTVTLLATVCDGDGDSEHEESDSPTRAESPIGSSEAKEGAVTSALDSKMSDDGELVGVCFSKALFLFMVTCDGEGDSESSEACVTVINSAAATTVSKTRSTRGTILR